MNYIKILLVLSISFLSVAGTAQKAVFKSDVQKFIKLSNDSNWDGVIDMMHPSMFKSFSKEQMSTMLNQMNSLGLKTAIDFKSISSVTELIENDGSSYQKFDYNVNVVISMTDQLWAQKDFMLNAIKANFDGKNVSVDESKKEITMDGMQSMLAIKDPGTKAWKYLTFQGANDALAKSAVPSTVFDQIVK